MTARSGEPRRPGQHRRPAGTGLPYPPDPGEPPDPAGPVHTYRRGDAWLRGVALMQGRRRDTTRPGSGRRRDVRPPVPADAQDLGSRVVARLRACGQELFLDIVLKLLAVDGYQSATGHRMTLDALGHTVVQGVIWHDPCDADPLFVVGRRIGIGRTVGVREVRELSSAMAAQPTRRGCVVTTGRFTEEARAYVRTLPSGVSLRLVDERQLGELMVRHRMGVRWRVELDVDEEFFEIG